MDWLGIALLAVGLATLQYVLEEGSRNDWFESRAHHRAARCRRGRRAGRVRHPRADRAGARRSNLRCSRTRCSSRAR